MPAFAEPQARHALAVACISAATDHPARIELANEVHARPFLRIDAPARVTHLAIMAAGSAGAQIHSRLADDFCGALGLPPPAPGTRHLTHGGDGLQVKWERHTEFSTLTVVGPAGTGEPFACWHDAAIQAPPEWTEGVAGKRLAALQIEVLKGAAAGAARHDLERWFAPQGVVGSRVLGSGEVWCDWQIGSDGFSRFLVLDLGFRENQVGRLVQRLAEIETYRLMALLALPIAREMLGQLESLDSALGGMNRTASTQLKLQHAVEGLSVVAISYYAVSLITHILTALDGLGLHINVALAEMFLIPAVVAMSFLMVRGVRRRLTKA